MEIFRQLWLWFKAPFSERHDAECNSAEDAHEVRSVVCPPVSHESSMSRPG